MHQEHGIKIFTNVCKAYFSPRLGDEHKRVSDKVKNDEIVVDLFTGVGSFPLHIARKKDATITRHQWSGSCNADRGQQRHLARMPCTGPRCPE